MHCGVTLLSLKSLVQTNSALATRYTDVCVRHARAPPPHTHIHTHTHQHISYFAHVVLHLACPLISDRSSVSRGEREAVVQTLG